AIDCSFFSFCLGFTPLLIDAYTTKMKQKHLYTLFLLVLTLSLGAQSNKGSVYLAGNTNFSLTTVLDGSEESRVALQSARIGYFLSNRFLLGTDLYLGSRDNRQQFGSNSSYYLRPFLRYYLTNRGDNKLNYFGQLGLYTLGDFGFGTNFETDFHFGAGVEIGLYEGLVATGLLRYRARAFGLNYTELELGLNVLLGGNQAGVAPFPVRGEILIDPAFGSLQFGSRKRVDEDVTHLIGNLRLNGLYFLSEKWLAEVGFAVNTSQYESNGSLSFERRDVGPNDLTIQTWIGARRILSQQGRLRPYLSSKLLLEAQRIERDDFFIGGRSVVIKNTDEYAALGGGAFYYLSDRIALDGKMDWNLSLTDTPSFVQTRIGLKVLLPRR
ncbi:MAG: hypothetical protein AAGF89_08980, partial [Bacteroidota bacterium]